jgi:hypothetical protein
MLQDHRHIELLEWRVVLAVGIGASVVRAPVWTPVWDTQPQLVLSANPVSPIGIKLIWQSTMPTARGSTGIIVERAQPSQPFQPIATVSGATSFIDNGLVSNSPYSYRIRPANSATYTNIASTVTLKYDAGLSGPFLHAAAVIGQTRSILSYGATSNNSSNDDAAAIRSAIAASGAGDEVYIPNGVYHIKARDIKLKTGVSIRGQSMPGAVLSAMFTDAGIDNPNSQMFRAEQGVNNLTISNLRIEMSAGQSMEYGFYLGSGSATATNVSRIALRSVQVEDFEKFAIAIRNGDNILVQDSVLKNATALGGGGQGYGVMIGYDNSFNNWITGNTIGPIIRHAVVIQYRAHHNLIEENTAIENTLDAYDLHGEDEYSNEIRHNVAYGSGGFGIGIGNTGSTHDDSGPNNWIHHNEVYDSRGGVNVILGSDQQYIEDNYFHDNSNEGILVNNGGGSDLWFLRNTVTFNATGARIEDTTNLLMFDNTVTNNSGTGLIVGASTVAYGVFRNDLRNNSPAYQLDSLLGEFEDNLI